MSGQVSKSKRKKRPVYKCASCGRKLPNRDRVRWVYSKTTGNRYCPPGQGCGR